MTGEKPYSDVFSFYEAYDEAGRLDVEYFALERAHTRELIGRHLPPPPGVVLDVGGAAGAYSYWLAEAGYTVHLLDPVEKHLRQATDAAARHAKPLASIRQGDARELPFGDDSADAVLMLGPLCHLQEQADRERALREAARVLRADGVVFTAAISRFASFVDGLRGGALLDDPVFAVEGPAFALTDFEVRWSRPETRETLLRFLRTVETDEALAGASPHLLACARGRSAR